MTTIVASLFLPYTVEFKIDEQIDQNLVKDLTVEKKLPSSHTSQPLQIHTSSSILARSLNTQSANEFRTNNSSIEDFFNQGSSVGSPKGTNEFYSNKNNSSNSFNDELDRRLLKLNRPSSPAFVPKPTVNHALLKKSVNQSEVSLAKVHKTIKKQSNLKYEQIIKPQETGSETADVSERTFSSESSSSILSDDEDDNYDSLYNHKVPKFGGFSRKNVLKAALNETNELVFKDFDIVPFSKGNGALKTAVTTTLAGDCKWVGTIGIATDRLPEQTKKSISEKLSQEYQCESVLPSDSTFQGHYKNFCKQILWPTLHYQIPDNPNSKAFEDHSWEFYKELNQDFASRLVEIYNDGDIIWIHDYHLFLVPKMVREYLPNAKIGFFLHVSFPSSELFKCFAQREYLLEGILAANFIAFQTDEYCRHFGQTCNKLLLADISKNEIRYKGSVTEIASSPVGIDAKTLTEQFHNSELIKSWRSMIRDRWPNKTKLIVGRDKFDRIRGVKQKLLSYEMFLKNNPEYIENTTLIQICLKSSKDLDTKLESEIMTIIDRINSLAPNISSSSQPVVFLHQDIDFIQYLALIAEADCFIVSSMREGMNLTCHEFIVATESKQSPLILSEFTGSASVFNDGDVFKINPWDLKQFSQAIKSALDLPDEQKVQHWNNLINVVKNQDCSNWVNFNLEKIQESWKIQNDKELFNYQIFNFNKFHESYKSNDGKKIFILNLSNIIPTDRILKILLDLTMISNNEIYIFSNFKKIEMERYYRFLIPKIGFIAENGALIKLANSDQSWISLTSLENFHQWVKNSKNLFTSFEERLPGSFFEIGQTFIKFHTESCCDKSLIDPERKSSLIGDLISHINDFNHEDNNESTLNRNDSIASNTTMTTNSTLKNSTNLNTFNLTDLNIHATLNDLDEIIYIESADIPIKVINFLIDYYSDSETYEKVQDILQSNDNNCQVVDIDDYSNSTVRPITSNNGQRASLNTFRDSLEKNNSNKKIQLLTVAGHRNIIFDSVFDYLNENTDNLKEENKVENIFTIGYENGVNSRGAREYVEGLNDLFSILQQLTN